MKIASGEQTNNRRLME